MVRGVVVRGVVVRGVVVRGWQVKVIFIGLLLVIVGKV